MRRLLAVIAALTVTTGSSAGPLETLLEVVSPDAEWCMVIPNLDRAGDDMANMIEGMDRSQLLLGNRPLDLLKSLIGLNSGVDDFGCGGLVAMPSSDSEIAWVLLIPFTELDLFLSANFDPAGEADAFEHGDGTVWYAKPANGHVVLGLDAAAVRRYDIGGGIGQRLATTLGERGRAVVDSGDMAMLGTQRGWGAVIDALKPKDVNSPATTLLDGLHLLMDEVEFGVLSFDFDPLALVLRDYMVLRDDTTLGALSDGGEGTFKNLTGLPVAPFMLAGSIDLRGLGGVNALRARLAALGLPTDIDWLANVDAFDVMLPPPDGRAPITDRVRLRLHGSDPDAIATDIDTSLTALVETEDGVVRTLTTADGDSPSISLQVESLGAHPPLVVMWAVEGDDMEADAMRRLLGGTVVSAAGLHISLHRMANVLDVHGRMLPASHAGTPRGAADSMATDFVVTTMRSWMPADPDIELYVNPALVARQFQSSLAGLRMFGLVVPAFDEAAPPVGIAIDVQDGTVQTTTIIPSGVTAPLADAVITPQSTSR